MLGGVTYCLTAYSAFHYAPAAHAGNFPQWLYSLMYGHSRISDLQAAAR